MEKVGTADTRRHAHPTGEPATCGKSLHIRVIRVIRGFHFRIQNYRDGPISRCSRFQCGGRHPAGRNRKSACHKRVDLCAAPRGASGRMRTLPVVLCFSRRRRKTDHTPASPRPAMRPLWRDLILRVWGADPLHCPCCKATMKPMDTFIRHGESTKAPNPASQSRSSSETVASSSSMAIESHHTGALTSSVQSPASNLDPKPLPKKCLAKRRGRPFSRTALERRNLSATEVQHRKSAVRSSMGSPLHPSSSPRSPTPIRALAVHVPPGAKANSQQSMFF